MDRPPERIELDVAVLRRHRAADVAALHAAIEASRDHLRPFMAWADQDRAATATFVSRTVDGWEAGDSFSFIIAEHDSVAGEPGRPLGGCGLHRRDEPGAIEIGYWLRADAVGRGVVTAASAALTSAAFDALDDVQRVEIRCDESNVRSAAVAQRLGFHLTGVEEYQPDAPGQTGRRLIWACARSDVDGAAP